MLEAGIAAGARSRQLGPGGPDRARQRAGHRRPRLALGARRSRSARSRYYLNITRYADELLAQVEHGLPGWPERVADAAELDRQEQGVRFAFPHEIRGDDGELIQDGKLWVFTTRADTIMGVSFCAVAPEHPLAAHAARPPARRWRVHRRSAGPAGTTEAEMATAKKLGMPTGLGHAPADARGIEVWVGNYVLMSYYGDGAVMGVPAHDERDFEFAKKYGLPITQVIGRGRGVQLRPLAGLVCGQGARHHRQLRPAFERAVAAPARGRRDRRRPPRRRARRQDDALALARLGHQPPALLGHADPDRPLRRLRRRAGARRPTCRSCCRKTWCPTAAAIR